MSEPSTPTTTTIANAISIRPTATGAQELWTSACIEDQLLIDLCETETTLSADILEDLSKDSGGRVLKYRAEFLHTAHLISASDYHYFHAFRIDPRDLSTRVKRELLAINRKTQDRIVLNVIERMLRSSNKLLYLEHIQPNKRRLSWKWEVFDFLGGGLC